MTEPENQNPDPKMAEVEKKEVKEDKYAIKYPLAGYAPGNYMNMCVTCKKEFIGDKRAVQCELCALRLIARAYNQLEMETASFGHWLIENEYKEHEIRYDQMYYSQPEDHYCFTMPELMKMFKEEREK